MDAFEAVMIQKERMLGIVEMNAPSGYIESRQAGSKELEKRAVGVWLLSND
jgi:hypothetical protein